LPIRHEICPVRPGPTWSRRIGENRRSQEGFFWIFAFAERKSAPGLTSTPRPASAALPEAARTCRSRVEVSRERRGGAAREPRDSRVGGSVETLRATSKGRRRFLFGVRGGLTNPRFRRGARRPTRRRRETSDRLGRDVERAETPGARQRRGGELVGARGWRSESRRAANGRGREARTQVRYRYLPSECTTPWGRGAHLPGDAQGARRAGAPPSRSACMSPVYAPAAGPSRNPNGNVRRRPPAPPARARPLDVIFLHGGNPPGAREKLTRTGPTAPARVPAGSPASDDADPTRTPPTHALHRKQAPRGREQRRETRGRGDRPGLGGPMRIDRIRRGAGRPRGGGFTNAFLAVAAPLRRAARRARRARLAVARARVRGEYRGRRRQGEGARGVERRGGGGGGGGGGVGGAGARRRRRRRRRRVGVRRVLPPREEDVAQAEEEAGQENGRRTG